MRCCGNRTSCSPSCCGVLHRHLVQLDGQFGWRGYDIFCPFRFHVSPPDRPLKAPQRFPPTTQSLANNSRELQSGPPSHLQSTISIRSYSDCSKRVHFSRSPHKIGPTGRTVQQIKPSKFANSQMCRTLHRALQIFSYLARAPLAPVPIGREFREILIWSSACT